MLAKLRHLTYRLPSAALHTVAVRILLHRFRIRNDRNILVIQSSSRLFPQAAVSLSQCCRSDVRTAVPQGRHPADRDVCCVVQVQGRPNTLA